MKLYKTCAVSVATHSRAVVWNNLPWLKVNSWECSPCRWRRRAPKRFRVLVKQRDFVYENGALSVGLVKAK
jgi:hypothetical protein